MATSQFKIRFPVLAMIYVPALMFMLAVAALASLHDGISVGVLLSDPASTLGTHPLLGVQSNLGVLVWCAAAAICLFSSAILRFTRTDKEVRSFLLWAGVITSVLLLDDFFLFHDDLALRYLPFDGDANYVDEFIIASYGLALALYLVRFRERILGSEYLLLLILAFLFLVCPLFSISLLHRLLIPLCTDFFTRNGTGPGHSFLKTVLNFWEL
jgi:hypothetical protein